MPGYDERYLAHIRCDHAFDRGVPFPEHWLTAMRCAKLQQIADASVRELQDETVVTSLECVVLGVPKGCVAPENGVEGVVGSTVCLKTDGGQRKDYLPCAKVNGSRWFVHSGSLADGSLDEEEPFGKEDLVERDISQDAVSETRAPRRRVGPRINGAQLQAMARMQPQSWSATVAYATWCAEDKRATQRLFDFATACRGYEPNPFKWKS